MCKRRLCLQIAGLSLLLFIVKLQQFIKNRSRKRTFKILKLFYFYGGSFELIMNFLNIISLQSNNILFHREQVRMHRVNPCLLMTDDCLSDTFYISDDYE